MVFKNLAFYTLNLSGASAWISITLYQSQANAGSDYCETSSDLRTCILALKYDPLAQTTSKICCLINVNRKFVVWAQDKATPYRHACIILSFTSAVNYSPCMSGTIFQAPKPPVPMNWPMKTSIARAGIPTRMTVMKYGTKKAPEMTCAENEFLNVWFKQSAW